MLLPSLRLRAGVSVVRTSPAASSAVISSPLPLARQVRLLSSTSSREANYRRFGEPRSTPQSQSHQDQQGRQNLSPAQLTPLAALARQLIASRASGRGGGGGGNSGKGPRRGTGPIQFLTNMPPIFLLLIGGGGLYYFAHLETVPYTGRTRFMDLSRGAEMEMGVSSYNEVLAQYKRKIYPANHPVAKEVREVATRIVRALEEGGLEVSSDSSPSSKSKSKASTPQDEAQKTKWEVFVIDDEQKNAFVLPGGKIFVFSGILDVTKNQDGLATVLGHEVAHQALRHSAEKASSFKVLLALSFGLELMGIDFGLSRSLLTLLMSLPNSRKLESEADRLGLRIMSAACFDPRESTGLWKRMESSEGTSSNVLSSVGAILSTHPVNAQRVKDLEKWIPEATSIREAHSCPPASSIASFRSQGMGAFGM